MLLSITLLGPIRFLGGTADALGWPHCIGGCCRLLCFCPLYFLEVLPMHSDGPIALADAATNYFALASYISGRHCRYTQMGPWHWRMLLIALLGPIRFLGGTADA